MLRVGLTGGLASGKSTAAHLFAALGVHVLSADEIGRALMQPGQAVYDEMVRHFGEQVVLPGGALDRAKLSDLAFREGKLDELNAIVHPPVIAAEEESMAEIFAADREAIVMVESALIFEASGTAVPGRPSASKATVPGWRERFDRIVLVTAPDEQKLARFVDRAASLSGAESREVLMESARLRLAAQIPDDEKVALADFVIDNSRGLPEMEDAVSDIFQRLKAMR